MINLHWRSQRLLIIFTGFNLGKRQCGVHIDDVILPPWAANDAHLFVKVHRQALESDYVTAHLQGWIDLVFGWKQTGQAAVDACNTYHPLTYFGRLDVNKSPSEMIKLAVLTAINIYGQTPKQLFKTPHPRCARAQPPAYQRASTAPVLQPMSGLRGVKWGVYCGSPACDEPVARWIQQHATQVNKLVALPTGEVFGLARYCHLMVNYSKPKAPVDRNKRRDAIWAAILEWGHPDAVVRIRNKRNKPPVNFLPWSVDDQVSKLHHFA